MAGLWLKLLLSLAKMFLGENMLKMFRNGMKIEFCLLLLNKVGWEQGFLGTKSVHSQIFFSAISPSMDMPFGIFSIYGVLKLPEFLAYDWSIFLCLKPLVTKLDVLCGKMTGPLC